MKQHFVQRAYIELFFQPTDKGNRLFVYDKSHQRWHIAQSGANLLHMADWQSDADEIEDGKVETRSFPVIKKLSEGQTKLTDAETELVKEWVALHSNRKKEDINHFMEKGQNVAGGRRAFKLLDKRWLEHRAIKAEKSIVDLILPDALILEIEIEGETCVMFAAGPKMLVMMPPISRANDKITNPNLSLGELFNRSATKLSTACYIAPNMTKYYENLPQADLDMTKTIQHQQVFVGTVDETVKMLMNLPISNPKSRETL